VVSLLLTCCTGGGERGREEDTCERTCEGHECMGQTYTVDWEIFTLKNHSHEKFSCCDVHLMVLSQHGLQVPTSTSDTPPPHPPPLSRSEGGVFTNRKDSIYCT